MNHSKLSAIRSMIWGAGNRRNRPAVPPVQLEFPLDCRQYRREDREVLAALRQIRADLAKG